MRRTGAGRGDPWASRRTAAAQDTGAQLQKAAELQLVNGLPGATVTSAEIRWTGGRLSLGRLLRYRAAGPVVKPAAAKAVLRVHVKGGAVIEAPVEFRQARGYCAVLVTRAGAPALITAEALPGAGLRAARRPLGSEAIQVHATGVTW